MSASNAARMAAMADVLAREGFRLNRGSAAAASKGAPPPTQKAVAGLTVSPQADSVTIQTSLGNFRSQQDKLVVKAFVRPEAYSHVLKEQGRSSEAAVPFADDPAWLYKARWVTSLPFLFAHPSITRCGAADA